MGRDDWGADLRCLCSGGGRELRLGLGERSYSSMSGAVVGQKPESAAATSEKGNTGGFRLVSRRENQSEGEGIRRPIRDRTKWWTNSRGGFTGGPRDAHKVCFR